MSDGNYESGTHINILKEKEKQTSKLKFEATSLQVCMYNTFCNAFSTSSRLRFYAFARFF